MLRKILFLILTVGLVSEVYAMSDEKEQNVFESSGLAQIGDVYEISSVSASYTHKSFTAMYDDEKKLRSPAWIAHILFCGAASETLEHCLVKILRSVKDNKKDGIKAELENCRKRLQVLREELRQARSSL